MISLLLKTVATVLSGIALRDTLITDATTIENEANRIAAKVDPALSADGLAITLGGVQRTTWPAAGGTASGLNDVLQNGATGNLPAGATEFTINDTLGNPLLSIDKATGGAAIAGQSLSEFTTGGTSTAFTLTPTPAITALATAQKHRVKFNATAGVAPTMAVSGMAAKALKYYDHTGAKVACGPASIVASMLSDMEYDGTDYVVMNPLKAEVSGSSSHVFSAAPAAAAENVVRADQNKNDLTSVSAAIATGKLTLGLQPGIFVFRNSDVKNGAPNTKFVSTALTLATDNNGASLGLITAVQGRLILLAIDTGSSVVLGVVNQSGAIPLTEEGVLTSTTAITGAVTSASTVYTTAALGAGLYPYKVVGAVDITWTSGSGYITTPALVTGAGGNALSSMSSFGYGQTLQTVTRTKGAVYYNTTGKPIELYVRAYSVTVGDRFDIFVGGASISSALIASSNRDVILKAVIPPNIAYYWADGIGTFTSNQINEMR